MTGKRALRLWSTIVFATVRRVGPRHAAMSPHTFDPSRYHRSFLPPDAPDRGHGGEQAASQCVRAVARG
ncbi:hypothetical protein GCM10009859_21100 [Kocuria salsicia]